MLVSGLAMGGWTGAAWGQEQRIVTSGRMALGGGSAGAISRASVERYATMLGMDEAQRGAAMTLYEGYASQTAQVRATMRKALEDARRASEEEDDPTVMVERMTKASEAARTESAALERTLMDDLRSLLTPEQAEGFVRVERARRREVAVRSATVSGEGVDLLRVVEVSAPGVKSPELGEAVVAYEVEIDRLIQARPEADAFGGFRPGVPIDVEKMQAAMKERAESGKKIAEANERHARKIEALLPEEARVAFRREFDRQAFPRVYREPAVMKDVAAAAAMEDVSPEQRKALAEIREAYEREARVLNERWSAAIRAQEADGTTGALAGGGGMVMISGGEEPGALVEARKARRELDERTRERLESAMSEKQRERLKKAREERAAKEREEESGGGGEGAIEVRSVFIQGDAVVAPR